MGRGQPGQPLASEGRPMSHDDYMDKRTASSFATLRRSELVERLRTHATLMLAPEVAPQVRLLLMDAAVAMNEAADALQSETGLRYRDAPDGRPFGAALATAVLQSNEYHHLDDLARAECDEILEHWKRWLKEGK
jgi:hypothetical protein